MIIDCNVTLGNWPFRRLRDCDPASFVGLMDSLGIAQAWVAPFEGILYKLVDEANEALMAQLAGLEDRLVLFPVVNPGFPGWEDDLAPWLESPAPGVRLYPSYHGYGLEDACCLEALERLSGAGKMVQIAVRVQDERHHHPLAMVKPVDLAALPQIATRFPGMAFIVLNGAPGGGCPANVYYEISHTEGPGGVATLARSVGASQVLFGTHAPYLYPESAFLKMAEADLSEEDRQGILGGNARRLMG